MKLHRSFLIVLVLVCVVTMLYRTSLAQGGSRARYWIECDSNGEARLWFFIDNYGWPEVLVYSSIGGSKGEWVRAEDIQPKYVNPHANRGADYVQYRVTARFSDGHFEEAFLTYRWPSGCSPTRAVVPQPTVPPQPTIDYPATDAARAATQQWIDYQNAAATQQAAQAATARAQAAEAARQATEQAIQIQNAEATRRAIEAEAAEAARRATEQAIQVQNANATATANAINTLTMQTNLTATALAQNQQNIEQTATAQARLAAESVAAATASAQTTQAQSSSEATATAEAVATRAHLDAVALTQTAQANTNATEIALANATASVPTPSGNTSPVQPTPVLVPPVTGNNFFDDNSTWLIPVGIASLVVAGGLLWFAREVRRKRILARTRTMPPLVPYAGKYEILHPIGSGGQGNLFLARHRNLGNYVALKQDDSGDAAQFQYEAQLLANLSHPHLPRVTDFFIDANGKRCLVMDYIQGENLEHVIQKHGSLTEVTALTWMRPIFDAVKYLHLNHVVHRDIKPSNIIITPQGSAVLVDFGIAKTLATGQLTRTGARGMGTAGYAPTEQYSGGTREPSDVYALGATLYYMLTGRVPVESTHRAAGTDLIPPRQFNPNISPRTEAAIMTAMNLAMNRRFASVALMEQALY